MLEAAGPEKHKRLLAGEPVVLRLGETPGATRQFLIEYLQKTAGLAGEPREEVERYWVVFTLGRVTGDSRGAHLVWSLVHPAGNAFRRRSNVVSIPHPWSMPGLLGADSTFTFSLLPTHPDDPTPRVSLNLTPEPAARPGATVPRTLDQVLETLAEGAGLRVFADGYLRPAVKFQANMQLKKCALGALQDSLGTLWGFEWKLTGEDPKTLLIRARAWWMEDEADVPQPLLEELRAALGPGKSPALEDLIRFAELTDAQAHKLVGSGICPGASGVVAPAWLDGTGIKPCLRFLGRLPEPLRKQALSPQGLPLREAPPQLVQQALGSTLVAACGAVTPEFQQDLVFYVTPGRDPGPIYRRAPQGWEVRITTTRPRGTRWKQYIQPPPPPNG
jgi:hypothetical protein